MAVKVRCSDCRKKIALDSAFAGSMCRCPYCKSIIMVPDMEQGVSRDSRLARPQRRPEKPGVSRSRKKRGLFEKNDPRKGGRKNVGGAAPIVDEKDIPIPRISPSFGGIEQPTRTKIPRGDKADSGRTPSARNRTPGPPIVGGSGLRETGRPPIDESVKLSGQVDALADLAGSGILAQGEPSVIDQVVHVDVSQFSEDQLAAIPTASPVRMQGIVSLILILVLVVMVAACVYLGIKMFSTRDSSDEIYQKGAPAISGKITELANPFTVGVASTVCRDVRIASPVVYCIDAGENLAAGGVFAFARDVVRASVLSLTGQERFGVVVAQDSGPRLISGKMFPGGGDGDDAIRDVLEDSADGGVVEMGGASSIAGAVAVALKQKPRTLVLIISRKEISDPGVMGGKIAAAGVRLVLVVLGSETDEQADSYEALVKSAGKGAVSRVYKSVNKLSGMYDEKNLP